MAQIETKEDDLSVKPLSNNLDRETGFVRFLFVSPDLAEVEFQGWLNRRIDNLDHRAEPGAIWDQFVTSICIISEEFADNEADTLREWLNGLFSREILFIILSRTERSKESFPKIPTELIYLILSKATPVAVLKQIAENAYRELYLRLDRLSFQTRLELSLQDLRRIIRIGQLLSTEKDFDILIGKILHEAMAVVGADAGSIYVTEPYQGEHPEFLRFKKSAMELNASEFLLPINSSSIAGYVAQSLNPLMIHDCYALSENEPYRFNQDYDREHNYFTRSMLVIPMKNFRKEIIGVIQLINKKREINKKLTFEEMRDGAVLPFSVEDMDKVSAVAGQAAVAIENNRLVNDIHNLFEGFVSASVTAIEQRDPTTSGHSFRVAEYTVGLAKAVDRLNHGVFLTTKFSREQIREIRYASLLHDFGKVGVREKVLVKAKKLYPDQLDEIRWKFRYAKKAIEQTYTERKLKFLKEHSHSEYRDYEQVIEAEKNLRLNKLEDMLQTIEMSNEPAITDTEAIAQIEEISKHQLELEGGIHVPFLTTNELLSLQVRRGNLDHAERLEIESHVTHTYRFLIQIPWTNDLRRVPDIAYGHHEKLDGTGYPLGLDQTEILPQTRMMTISDIFDALTAPDRPYKKSLRREAALDILDKEAKAGHIDKNLFQVFVDAKIFDLKEKV